MGFEAIAIHKNGETVENSKSFKTAAWITRKVFSVASGPLADGYLRGWSIQKVIYELCDMNTPLDGIWHKEDIEKAFYAITSERVPKNDYYYDEFIQIRSFLLVCLIKDFNVLFSY